MVEKLSLVAAENTAEVIILKQELEYLRKKNKAAADSSKIKSKTVLSKALVVTTEEVVRLRTQWEEKQTAATLKSELRTARAATKLEANLKGRNSPEKFSRQKALLVPSTPGLVSRESSPSSSENEWEEIEEFIPVPTSPYIGKKRKLS